MIPSAILIFKARILEEKNVEVISSIAKINLTLNLDRVTVSACSIILLLS